MHLGIHCASSLNSVTRGNSLEIALEIASYSLSVVDNAISVCYLDDHVTGQPANIMKYPVRDLAVSGSHLAASGSQFPENDAST